MEMASDDQTMIDFKLGHKKIGLFLGEVNEIIEPVTAIKVPMTHPFFRGFISLRGEVIPLIDLPKVMHAEENPYDKEDEKYVIVSTGGKKAALLVHAIGGTHTVRLSELSATSEEASAYGLFLKQAAFNDGTVPLLNLERMMAITQELNSLERK